MEIWKDIKNYEELYQVSHLGRVKRLEGIIYNPRSKTKTSPIRGTILNQATDRGYKKVVLCKDGKVKTFRVHQLVWDNFFFVRRHGKKATIFDGWALDHIDNDKGNNKIDNLQLLSHSANVAKHNKTIKTSSEYTGVHSDKRRGKWKAEIRINNIKKHLGRFENELDAANAYRYAYVAGNI